MATKLKEELSLCGAAVEVGSDQNEICYSLVAEIVDALSMALLKDRAMPKQTAVIVVQAAAKMS